MEDYKGKMLRFDGNSFQSTKAAYYKVIKVINEAAIAYEDLDTNFKFTQEVLAEMLAKDIEKIKQRYAEVIDAQIELSKFTSKAVIETMKGRINSDVSDLYNKIEKISETIQNLGSYQSPLVTIHFDASNISILDSRAILSQEAENTIKDKFETKIRTDLQNEFYNLCLTTQRDFEKVVEFLQQNKPQIVQARALYDQMGNGVFSVYDNILCINAGVIATV